MLPTSAWSSYERFGIITNTTTATPHIANLTEPNTVAATTTVKAVVISEAGTVLVAESFWPGNGRLDPGETVTVSFGLQNVGAVDITNLVVTLLPTDGVTLSDGPQTYDWLLAGGPVTARDYTFTVDPTLPCGSILTATLQLQDGPTDLGTVSYTFTFLTSSFANLDGITIPTVFSNGGPPSLSTLAVSGFSGPVSQVTVTFRWLNHTFPDDIDILLVGPSGQNVMLMSDAGGAGDAYYITLTFADMAATSLPDTSLLTSGTFKPTNHEPNGPEDPFNAPAPAGPYGTTLSIFNGIDPNGTWSLFAIDDTPWDNGGILVWKLDITTTTLVCATNIVNLPLILK